MLRDPALVPLSRDHQHGLALCVLTERALREDKGSSAVPRVAREIVDKFDSEIRAHFDFEERALFPALGEFATFRDLIAELLGEHQVLLSIVQSLRSAPDRATIERFTTLLQDHIRKEERILFEEAQRILPPERLAAITE